MFKQALALQQNRPATPASRQPSLQWLFAASVIQPDRTQITELYQWLTQAQDISGYRLELLLGPDWLSSYRRGKVIRNYIPRGLMVTQTYSAEQPAHSVALRLLPQAKTSGGDTHGD